MAKKKIIVLGSTGSVGRQTLEVVKKYPDLFEVVGLSSHSNEALLQSQIDEFNPKYYHFGNGKSISFQQTLFDFMEASDSRFTSTLDELAAKECDLLVCAIAGIAGFSPTLIALKNGVDVASSNKESIVAGGHLFNEASKMSGAKLIPVDSEHSAIWQCLWGEKKQNVKSIIITASGGAFRDMTKEQIKDTKARDALLHPVWKMGKKVTIDSATLFNKGLEVAEAVNLFEIAPENVSVVIHPECAVHGLVEFCDNSIKASLASADMMLPIELALFHPDRANNSVKPIDITKIGSLNFSKPDYERFPCLEIALEGVKKGNGTITALSAADEILVDKYINDEISFYQISHYLEKVLKKFDKLRANAIEEIFSIDFDARQYTLELVGQ